MTGADETIIAEATAWHLASEREAMDWSGFTAWLEADPRHRTVYDEVALTDAALEHHRDALAPLDEDVAAAPRRRWPFWVGGALAASLAAVLVVPQLAAPAERTYATGATAQTIALADGSLVVLGPRSELTVAGRHGERLALRGGAYFEIRHVPDRAMAISAGGLQVTDIGTRFEIQSVGNSVRVEVAEGRLEVRGDALAAPVELTGGRRILFDPANRLATVGPISPQDVG